MTLERIIEKIRAWEKEEYKEPYTTFGNHWKKLVMNHNGYVFFLYIDEYRDVIEVDHNFEFKITRDKTAKYDVMNLKHTEILFSMTGNHENKSPDKMIEYITKNWKKLNKGVK